MWQEPKTNWVSTDFFNFSDYNRIKNNIQYLRELSISLFYDVPYEEMGDDKNSYTQYPYADEFNAMEQNLENMREYAFLYDNADMRTWYDNAPTPNYEDFNRLENACLLFYTGFTNQKKNKGFLSFRLGNSHFKSERNVGTQVTKDRLSFVLGNQSIVERVVKKRISFVLRK